MRTNRTDLSPPTKGDGKELLGRKSNDPKLPRFLLTDESRRKIWKAKGGLNQGLPPRRRKRCFYSLFFQRKNEWKRF
ncbi:hypothetical protein ACOSQ4_031735 [Xanthoceras sorbifolium]